mmetsp:Transcript_29321/g.64047  ORF Transcript_29321/g.64047 Transcript_29321/m.64047 type:complete len:221 (+) Transcript_29321:257-919(+)
MYAHSDGTQCLSDSVQLIVQRIQGLVQSFGRVLRLKSSLEKWHWLRKPTMQNQPRLHRILGALHPPHTVGNARIKHGELVELLGDRLHNVVVLVAASSIEVVPVVKHVRLKHHGLPSLELAICPVSQCKRERPRSVRNICVQLLSMPIDVVTHPNLGEAPTAQNVLSILEQRILKLLIHLLGKKYMGWGSHQCILLGYMPVVPDEALRSRITRIFETVVI